jgi:hypothetical protein
MTAEVIATQTADGWDVHVTEAKDVVVRTIGKRLTVATIPDDDDTPAAVQPLGVTFEPPSTTSA